MCPTQHTKHSHLTQKKRVVIEALMSQGNSIRAVAMVINVHYSTVSRELARNSGYKRFIHRKVCSKKARDN